MRHHGQRWFTVLTGAGFALGLLLLGNSVANYLWVSQRIVVDQVRKELSAQAATVERVIQGVRPGTLTEATALLEEIRSSSQGRIAWIRIQDGRDTSLALSRMHGRQAVYETRFTPGGRVVVEAFPIRVPERTGGAQVQLASYVPAARSVVGVVEIAAYLNGAGNLWPLQRNLLINSSAALALMGSLVLMRIRFGAYAAGQVLARQVAHARQVQQDLLPASLQDRGDFAMSGACSPASCLNGDFYDVFQVRGTGTAFVVGDVAGKGMPAAMLASVVQGAVRLGNWAGNGRQHVDATRQLNRLLCERAARERYASMFWGYFVPETGVLRYVNAGHLPPLLFRGQGAVYRLTSGGPVLGLLDGARYEQGERAFEDGDLLVLYTDGVVEAANASDEHFGEERLQAVVREHFDRPADEIRNAILGAVRAFTGDVEAADDQTLLLIRKTATPGGGRLV